MVTYTDRQKNLAHSLASKSLMNSGLALRHAVKKSPWRFSSWHQFSKYWKMG
jgi:hypothetical protein|tara:strand:- start:272 stop:427 length:156 start_codon:yes stop_codon:yes gene_type:complete